MSFNKNIYTPFYFLSVLLLTSAFNVFAHGEVEKKSSISASAHINFANKGTVDSDKIWKIPGTFVGGEAYPVEKGLNLEDIQLQGTWHLQPEYCINGKISSHHDGEIELENFWLSYYPQKNTTLELGKMDAKFSPSAGWHAYNSNFNEASLNAEVFFGGHFTDSGFRGIYQLQNFTLGLEAWNGDAWPASAGEYSSDIFAHYQIKKHHVNITTGLWGLYSEANQRADERYSVGHSHGNSSLIENEISVYFSGRNILAGMFIDLTWQLNHENSLGLYSEVFNKEGSGDINDDTRLAEMESEHHGFTSQIFFKHSDITYALRHDIMSFENTFNGVSAAFISADAGLVNNGFEPARTHLSVSKAIDAFIIRAEGILDKSSDEEFKRFTASVIWKEKLWEKSL